MVSPEFRSCRPGRGNDRPHHVELRPGSYTFEGTRAGFRSKLVSVDIPRGSMGWCWRFIPMSRLEEGLRHTRRRQIRFYIAGLIALVLVGVVVVGVLASTNGTAIKICPRQPRRMARCCWWTVWPSEPPCTPCLTVPWSRSARMDFREEIHAIQPGDLGRTIEVELEPLPGRLLATTDQGLPGHAGPSMMSPRRPLRARDGT